MKLFIFHDAQVSHRMVLNKENEDRDIMFFWDKEKVLLSNAEMGTEAENTKY